jgi:arylsulfatase A-like enzyme
LGADFAVNTDIPASSPARPAQILLLSLFLGLAYGFAEAAANGVFSLVPGALSWRSANAPPIVWVAPLVYAAAFGGVGVFVAILARITPRLPWDFVLVLVLVALGAYLLATLQGQLVSDLAAATLALGFGTILARFYRARRGTLLPLSRRMLPWLLGFTGAAWVVVTFGSRLAESRRMSALGAEPAGRPSVLLLVMDTQRGDHLSAAGYPRPTTPSLDSLAEQGLRYAAAFSPSSWTLPSHATLFTGRSQSEHQAGILRRPYLDDRFPTIAGELARAGYATGGFVANTFWGGRHTGLARGFQRYRDLYGNVADGLARTVLGRHVAYRVLPRFGAADMPGRKNAADVNHEFLDWLDGTGSRPFFAFLNYLDVHAPYLPPAPFDGMFSGEPRRRQASSGINIGALGGGEELRTPEAIRRAVDAYDEALRYLDTQIGDLVAELRRRGRLDNTLIIVTSDHGEGFGEHDMLNHGHSLYRDQIHVPLVLFWNRGITARVETGPVGIDRVPATVAAAAGLPAGIFPGKSLLDSASPAEPVLGELARRWTQASRWPSSRASWASLVAERWHYLAPDSGEVELYDYVADPDERRNLATDTALAAVRSRLDSMLRRLRAPAAAPTR